jgi:hypothetical protein
MNESDLEDDGSMELIPLNDDNEWTDEREKYCKRLANSRGAFVWLHSKSSRYYYIWNKVLSVIVLIASGVFAAIITISDVIPDWPDSWKVIVAFACITVAANAFGVIVEAIGLDGKSVDHSKASGKSTTLFMRISKEIQKPRERRVPAIKFIHSVMEEDSVLRNQSSHIPGHVLRKYYAKFDKSAIEYDILFGEDELLKIEEEMKDRFDDSANGDKELEIVNRAMLRMTHGIHVESYTTLRRPSRTESVTEAPRPATPREDLEAKLKQHDKKHKRVPPELSKQQLFDLEKYLND